MPFLYHLYAGVVPPLVTLAVKVTEVAAHIVVAVADTVTDGISTGLTVKLAALVAVPLGVVTVMTPAPAIPEAGVAVILVALDTV